MSNVVQPRWKRRADEIADAIGDELSVTVLAPVEVGNDVRIHSDSITLFANSIAAVLPTAQEIAAAMWTYSSRSVDTDAVKASDLNLDVTGKLRVVGEGHISVDVTHVDGNTISGGAAVPVETSGNKTVAVTGQVSTNIGNVTVPISNPNNITVPVTNPNNLTVPVSIGNATVPVKASTSGIAQNQYGNTVVAPVANSNNVTVPVTAGNVSVPLTNPNNLTVPVANSNNVTVPVTAGGVSVPVHVPVGTTVPASVSNTLSVPVSVGQAVVPVQNTANVSVPVANSNNVSVPVATVSGTTQAADAAGAAVTVPAQWNSSAPLDVNVTNNSVNTVVTNTNANAVITKTEPGNMVSVTGVVYGVHTAAYGYVLPPHGSGLTNCWRIIDEYGVSHLNVPVNVPWDQGGAHPNHMPWQFHDYMKCATVVGHQTGYANGQHTYDWYLKNPHDILALVNQRMVTRRETHPGHIWSFDKRIGGNYYIGQQITLPAGTITWLEAEAGLLYLSEADSVTWRTVSGHGANITSTTYTAGDGTI